MTYQSTGRVEKCFLMLGCRLVLLIIAVLKVTISLGQVNEPKWVGSFSSEDLDLRLRPDGSFVLKSLTAKNSYSIAGDVIHLNNDTAELCYHNLDSIIPINISSASRGITVELVFLQTLGCEELDTLDNPLLNELFKISLVSSQMEIPLNIGWNDVPNLINSYYLELSFPASFKDTTARKVFRSVDFVYTNDMGYNVKLYFILNLLNYRDLGRVRLFNNDNDVYLLYENGYSEKLYRYVVIDR